MTRTVTCVDINGDTFEVPTTELNWRPSAYGIVIKDKKILLSKQFDGYDLPGGGLDFGETPEHAVVREVKEETGINTKEPKLLSVETSFFKMTHYDTACYQSILMYYSCEFVGGELSIEGFDEEEKKYADMPEWISLEKLKDIKVASSFDWRVVVKKVA